METQIHNIFILADNALVVNGLRHHLESRFKQNVNITGFCEGRNCLKKVDRNTQAVILDYYLAGKSCMPVRKCIRAINPHTKIIMHTCYEDIVVAIDALIAGRMTYDTSIKPIGDKGHGRSQVRNRV